MVVSRFTCRNAAKADPPGIPTTRCARVGQAPLESSAE